MMTREEAAEVLELLYGDCDPIEENAWQALRMGVAALRGPQPDPGTGLVPCGCGGKAVHMVWPDKNFPNGLRLYVICGECMTETSGFNETKENAANRWNRAMGYKEADK